MIGRPYTTWSTSARVPFARRFPAHAWRCSGSVVAASLRRELASSRGPVLLRGKPDEPPGGARLVERRDGLWRMGRKEIAHGGRVGVRGSRRAGAERLRVGRRADTRCRVVLQHLARYLPLTQYDGG